MKIIYLFFAVLLVVLQSSLGKRSIKSEETLRGFCEYRKGKTEIEIKRVYISGYFCSSQTLCMWLLTLLWKWKEFNGVDVARPQADWDIAVMLQPWLILDLLWEGKSRLSFFAQVSCEHLTTPCNASRLGAPVPRTTAPQPVQEPLDVASKGSLAVGLWWVEDLMKTGCFMGEWVHYSL